LVTDTSQTPILATDEVLAYLKKRQGILDGVCVTGGEPTLQVDLPDFLRRLKEMGYAVKLDTNGTSPDTLRALIARGLLDYVAMDIKNCRERYGVTAGKIPFDTAPIEESVKLLMSGSVPYEFRTTTVRGIHTAADFRAIGQWIAGAERYYLQGFVDSGSLIGGGFEAFTPGEMREFLAIAREWVPSAQLRGID
jgi:pyruvate formate lyase activating enzyme